MAPELMFLASPVTDEARRAVQDRLSWWWRFRHRSWTRVREELLHLPAYLVEIPAAAGVSPIRLLVDGRDGHWCFAAPAHLAAGVRGVLAGAFAIDEARAGEVARETVKRLVLYRAFGARRFPERGPARAQAVAYPLWVQYFRRKGAYNVLVVDGLTGNHADSRLRRSLLVAVAGNLA